MSRTKIRLVYVKFIVNIIIYICIYKVCSRYMVGQLNIRSAQMFNVAIHFHFIDIETLLNYQIQWHLVTTRRTRYCINFKSSLGLVSSKQNKNLKPNDVHTHNVLSCACAKLGLSLGKLFFLLPCWCEYFFFVLTVKSMGK